MIKINGKEIAVGRFPDGTQHFKFKVNNLWEYYNIEWYYENDSEMATLYFAVCHIREHVRDAKINLFLPYVPNARMDRVKHDEEVFTLKYFCKFINSLNFNYIMVLDPHSNVTNSLLDNVISLDISKRIEYALNDIEGIYIDGGKSWGGKTVIYFPDEGAMKRYGDMEVFGNREKIFGKKKRDWDTGKILGIEIFDRDGNRVEQGYLDGKVVLMVDDIVSYGGTMAYSADKLKNDGAMAIYAYATHAENSVVDEENGTLIKRLENGVVDGLFTTNSVHHTDKFNECEYVTVIEEDER